MRNTFLFIVLFWMVGTAAAWGQMPQQINTESEDNYSSTKVSGFVLEKGTRKKLGEITFHIRKVIKGEIVQAVATDANGEFGLNLTPGEYQAVFMIAGYERKEMPFIVSAKEPAHLDIRLIPQVANPYQIVVKQKRDKVAVSARELSAVETAAMPGAPRDILGAVSNLPGVSTSSVFNGYGNGLVIRGSASEESYFALNDHSIPIFYHFGGFESIIEPELVESITFDAGGFSAEHGNATGGVVTIKLKDPRTDRIGGFANISLLSTSAMVEGPLSQNDSFSISIKRGFLDAYVRTAMRIEDESATNPDFTTYPMYHDGSFMYKHRIHNNNELKLIGIGSSDRLALVAKEASASERYSNQLDLNQEFFNLIGEWNVRKGDFKSVLSPLISYQQLHWSEGPRAYEKRDVFQYGISQKITYRLNAVNQFKAGLRFMAHQTSVDSVWFVQLKEGEIERSYSNELVSGNTIQTIDPSLYLMDEIQLNSVTITPGGHFLWDPHNGHSVLDPRLSVRFQATRDLILKTALGQYSMRPLMDECHEPWGTEGLEPESALHYVGGFEYRLAKNVSLDIQGYRKEFHDLVVRSPEDPTHFTNSGSGHAYGMECLIRHDMTDSIFGWVAYSYCVSKRKDGTGKSERYFDNDITHTVKTVINYKPNLYWSIGLKYEYASGAPYTDLLNVPTWYDVDQDYYNPIYTGTVNNQRLSDHHQLDFRIDRYWLFDDMILSTYLDVRNVLQNRVVVDMIYNKDYTQQEEQVSLASYVPLIFLGVKLDF